MLLYPRKQKHFIFPPQNIQADKFCYFQQTQLQLSISKNTCFSLFSVLFMMADTIEGFLCRLSLHLCHILFLPKICVSAEKAVFCTISIAGNWIFLPERAMINFTDDPIPLRWVFFFQDSFLLLFSRGGQLLCKKTALSINDHAPIPFVAWTGWISGGKGKTRIIFL